MSPVTASVLRNTSLWFLYTVVFPVGLILYLVVVERASLESAVGNGEFFALGVAVSGGAAVIEMILLPGRLGTSLYQGCILIVLGINIAMFAGTAEVTDHRIQTSLDSGQVGWSIVLLLCSVVVGLGAVIRQSRQQALRADV